MFTTLDSPLAAAPAWFPLVPRDRPACQAPADRITDLDTHADAADTHPDANDRITAATRALNLAALLLSDVGHARQASELCTAQYDVFRRHAPLGELHATWALQPLVNIARLRTRAGDGPAAHRILTALHHAVTTDTPARIDGHDYDITELAPDELPTLAKFTWSVLLADGGHALVQAGRWTEALTAAREHHGVGERLLDGRQIAVLAHISAAEYDAARDLVAHTRRQEPWEGLVAVILAGLTGLAADHPPRLAPDEVEQYVDSLDQNPGLEVFRARATLLLLGLMDPDHPRAHAVGSALTAALTAAGDGYVARDLLSARWVAPHLSNTTRAQAVVTLHAAGLTTPLPREDVDHVLALAHRAARSLDAALTQVAAAPSSMT
ncbi:hypothetical protein GCM10027059_50030 [Myceligenerans halotolerans]